MKMPRGRGGVFLPREYDCQTIEFKYNIQDSYTEYKQVFCLEKSMCMETWHFAQSNLFSSIVLSTFNCY